MGLSARNKESYEDKLPRSERTGKPEVLLNQEMDLYRQALGLHDMNLTHCYLAECLIKANLQDQARSHIARALQMSPALPIALELQKEIQ